MLLDTIDNGLGISLQEASLSAGENVGVVLVPCFVWKCVPAVISSGVDIFRVPGCHLLKQVSSP